MADKQDNKIRRRFFNEYAFHQVIKTLNEKHDMKITTSMAREYHTRFENAIKEQGKDMSLIGYASFMTALRNTFDNVNVDSDFPSTWYQDRGTYFSNLCGFGKNPLNENMLPISPYDELYAHRGVVLKSGHNLLFTKIGSWRDSFGEDKQGILDEDGRYLDKDFTNGVLFVDVGEHTFRSIGDSFDKSDNVNLHMLAKYMSAEDYDNIKDWVTDIPEGSAMSLNAMKKAEAILSHLQSEGYSYSVMPDINKGQACVRLEGKNLTIRLIDSKENESFVGKVYNNGFTYRFMTDKSITDAKGNVRKEIYNPSIDDTIKLIDYALGKPVKRNDTNELVGTTTPYSSGKSTKYSSYYSNGTKSSFSALMGSHPESTKYGVKIRMENNRQVDTQIFYTPESAEVFVTSAVESARKNFLEQMDIDRLVKEANAHKDDPDYFPEFSVDPVIATHQQVYYDVLTGKQPEIIRKDMEEKVDEYKEALGNEVVESDENIDKLMAAVFGDKVNENLTDEDVSKYIYQGTQEEKVRQHLSDNVETIIGNTEDGFDIKAVAMYMTSTRGLQLNLDNLTNAISVSKYSFDKIKGETGYILERAVIYDETTGQPMYLHNSEFIRKAGETIKQTLLETGCNIEDKDILIDKNGVVSYTGQKVIRETKVAGKEDHEQVKGIVGQIFAPDGLGLVETKFVGRDNYMFVPGYEAYVVPQNLGENKSLEERTRLKGYEQLMMDEIRYRVRDDMLSGRTFVGKGYSLNSVYRHIYDTRYPLDFLERAKEEGLEDNLVKELFATNARRVKYGNEYKEQSTISAEYRGDKFAMLKLNDNFDDVYAKTGFRNMAIMSEQGDGYFDPIATGTGTNQGTVRFLVEGAVVNPDGSITKSEIENDRTPIFKNDITKYMSFTPFDRQQMTFSNLMKASAVAEGINTVHMTFGGWTFDDGFVVSKDFASRYKVRGKDGNMRELRIGDKISDMNGNKGVISLVVDRKMSEEEAKERGIEKPVAWFKANPSMDVVGAPFTAPSRFNGGTAREMMNNPLKVRSPEGVVYDGCMGKANYIITHMTVDEKTHLYDRDDLLVGKGRKVSSQLAWGLNAQDAQEVLKTAYSSNTKATTNLRELLISMGLDMDETGTLKTEYTPHEGEVRHIWTLPQLEYKEGKNGKILDIKTMKNKFDKLISHQGGFLEVPFPLKYPTGEDFAQLNDGKTDIVYKTQTYTQKSYTRVVNGKEIQVKGSTHHRKVAESKRQVGEPTYAMPIMSASLRSGLELENGEMHVHDYTLLYSKIYEQSLRYIQAREKGDTEGMKAAQNTAQSNYDKMCKNITAHNIETKSNIFKEELMSNRMAKSATAVWTADPRLNLDEIAMPQSMASSLGINEGQYVLTWRDPVLRDGGIRYNKVVINDELTGVAINPVMDKSYDGDFDGDSIGILNLGSHKAHLDAIDKLSVGANLLDFGSKDDEGKFDIAFNNGLDMKSVTYENESYKKELEDIKADLNEKVSYNDRGRRDYQTKTVEKLSHLVHNIFDEGYATDIISYKDMESHIKSVAHMVDNGAKGSYKKLAMYGTYLGCEFDVKEDADGKSYIDYDTLKDCNKSLATRKDDTSVEYATAVKSFGTGVAGKYSQRAMSALRNVNPKAVLELTYPVTQSILQAKHDPVEAKHKYEMLMSGARALWRGQHIIYDSEKDVWNIVREQDGTPVQASRDQWIDIFKEFYASKYGLNVAVNNDYITEVAYALADEDGVMRNIEEDFTTTSSMDRMTYHGNFDTLVELAKNDANLFEGKYTLLFAPKIVSGNKNSSDTDRQLEPVMKKDVAEGYKKQVREKSIITVDSKIPIDTVNVVNNNSDESEHAVC